jgi:hypothetical protein
MVLVAPALTPAQQEVLDQLGALGQTRPSFDAGLRGELKAALEEGVAPLVPLLDELGLDAEHPLTVSKHSLSQVHGCEVRFLAEDGVFPGWSVPRARGTVAHKAIELSIHMRGEPHPSELVDDALARLTEGDHYLSDWLQQLGEAERAELRAEACDRVTKFLECWPPLKAAWRPVTESSLRADLLDGRIALKGKVDLTLGRADGTTAGRTVAGKVLIDLKTGGFSPHHLDDLRFYALLEAVRLGVPPRRLSTYYLDRGAFLPEDVTEGLLATTVSRTVDGIAKIVALRAARAEPIHKPGPVCRWCPALDTCEVGQAHLAASEDW